MGPGSTVKHHVMSAATGSFGPLELAPGRSYTVEVRLADAPRTMTRLLDTPESCDEVWAVVIPRPLTVEVDLVGRSKQVFDEVGSDPDAAFLELRIAGESRPILRSAVSDLRAVFSDVDPTQAYDVVLKASRCERRLLGSWELFGPERLAVQYEVGGLTVRAQAPAPAEPTRWPVFLTLTDVSGEVLDEAALRRRFPTETRFVGEVQLTSLTTGAHETLPLDLAGGSGQMRLDIGVAAPVSMAVRLAGETFLAEASTPGQQIGLTVAPNAAAARLTVRGEDPLGNPVPLFTVTVQSLDRGSVSTLVAEGGEVQTDLAPGRYRLHAEGVALAAGVGEVSVGPADVTTVVVVVARRTTLRGRVRPGPELARDYRVVATMAPPGSTHGSVEGQVGADGRFSLSLAQGAEYELMISATERASAQPLFERARVRADRSGPLDVFLRPEHGLVRVTTATDDVFDLRLVSEDSVHERAGRRRIDGTWEVVVPPGAYQWWASTSKGIVRGRLELASEQERVITREELGS